MTELVNPALTDPLPRERVVEQIERSDPGFFSRLRKRLRSRMAQVFRRNSDVTAHEIEDLTQIGILRVLDRVTQFRGGRFTAWAMTVAIRAARTTLGRRRAAPPATSFEVGLLAGSEDACPVLAAARNELLGALHASIATALSPRQRIAIRGVLSGRTPVDVARDLDSNPNAVHKLCHDARGRLRRDLEERGFAPDDIAALTLPGGALRS